MKSTIISKSNPGPGFDTKTYSKQANKAVNKFKRNSKVIKLSGIQDKDQRSSNEYTTRVLTGKRLKPMNATFGASKGNKGVTIYKKGKA
jgi:hypothetical protein